jgi:hypothetical protein
MRVLVGTATHQVLMDYPMQPGESGEGPHAFADAAGQPRRLHTNSILVLLKKMNQQVTGIEADAHGLRREQHPSVLTGISLDIVVKGSAIDPEAVSRAVKLSEEQICPVWNMLKGKTPITPSVRIIEVPAPAAVGYAAS